MAGAGLAARVRPALAALRPRGRPHLVGPGGAPGGGLRADRRPVPPGRPGRRRRRSPWIRRAGDLPPVDGLAHVLDGRRLGGPGGADVRGRPGALRGPLRGAGDRDGGGAGPARPPQDGLRLPVPGLQRPGAVHVRAGADHCRRPAAQRAGDPRLPRRGLLPCPGLPARQRGPDQSLDGCAGAGRAGGPAPAQTAGPPSAGGHHRRRGRDPDHRGAGAGRPGRRHGRRHPAWPAPAGAPRRLLAGPAGPGPAVDRAGHPGLRRERQRGPGPGHPARLRRRPRPRAGRPRHRHRPGRSDAGVHRRRGRQPVRGERPRRGPHPGGLPGGGGAGRAHGPVPDPPFFDLPEAVLGAIVLYAILGFFRVGALRRIASLRPDGFAFALFTLFAVLFLEVLPGLVLAVLLSLALLLARVARPGVAVLGPRPTDQLRSRRPRRPRPAGLRRPRGES